jgi:hypothetical protein
MGDEGQPVQKYLQDPISTNVWLRWHVPVIPVMWEAQTG